MEAFTIRDLRERTGELVREERVIRLSAPDAAARSESWNDGLVDVPRPAWNGQDDRGDDAKHYQVRAVRMAIEEAKK